MSYQRYEVCSEFHETYGIQFQVWDWHKHEIVEDGFLRQAGAEAAAARLEDDLSAFVPALEVAKSQMMSSDTAKPDLALWQAGLSKGIEENDEMSRFVAWAYRELGFPVGNR